MYWSHLNNFWTEFILWFMYVSLHIKIRLLFSYLVSYSVIFVNEILDKCRNYSFQSHLPFDEMWYVKIICVVHSVVSHSLQPQGLQHARLPCPSVCPRVCSNSYPLSQWCHPTTSSSAALFSFCPQSFPASGSFPMSWLFSSDGQSIGASPSASVLPMNILVWFPFGLTGLISLVSKGVYRAFSTFRKRQ